MIVLLEIVVFLSIAVFGFYIVPITQRLLIVFEKYPKYNKFWVKALNIQIRRFDVDVDKVEYVIRKGWVFHKYLYVYGSEADWEYDSSSNGARYDDFQECGEVWDEFIMKSHKASTEIYIERINKVDKS